MMTLSPYQSKELTKLAKSISKSRTKNKSYKFLESTDIQVKLKKWYGGTEDSNELSYVEVWKLGKSRKGNVKWEECYLIDIKLDNILITQDFKSYEEFTEFLVNRVSVQESSRTEDLPARMETTLLSRSIVAIRTLTELNILSEVLKNLSNTTLFSLPSDCLSIVLNEKLVDENEYFNKLSEVSSRLIGEDPRSGSYKPERDILKGIPSFMDSLDLIGVSL